MANNKNAKTPSSKKSTLISTSSLSWLDKVTVSLFIWNAISLVFIIWKDFSQNTLKYWNINYGDYARTDLGYLIASSTFDTPYKYHPELPNVTVTNYLPLPFLINKILGIRFVEDWDKNAFNILFFAVFSVFLMGLIIYLCTSNFSFGKKILYSITYGVITVPTIYLFSTANIQGIITFVIFLSFLPLVLNRTQKGILNPKFLKILSFTVVGSSKPQYLTWNLVSFLENKKYQTRNLFLSVLLVIAVNVLGFSYFAGGFLNNFKYFLKSLFSFTTPDPAYIVHFNDSIIGNLLGIELLLNSNSIHTSFVLMSEKFILVLYLLASFTLMLYLARINGFFWLKLWLIGSLSVVAIPVSYAYSYTTFLIPLGLLLFNLSTNERETTEFFNYNLNKVLLFVALFATFSPKLGYLMLVPNVADSRVYSLFSSFGHIAILIMALVCIRFNYKKESVGND